MLLHIVNHIQLSRHLPSCLSSNLYSISIRVSYPMLPTPYFVNTLPIFEFDFPHVCFFPRQCTPFCQCLHMSAILTHSSCCTLPFLYLHCIFISGCAYVLFQHCHFPLLLYHSRALPNHLILNCSPRFIVLLMITNFWRFFQLCIL